MSKIPIIEEAIEALPPGEYVIERLEYVGRNRFRCVITEGPHAGRAIYVTDPKFAQTLSARVRVTHVYDSEKPITKVTEV